MENPQPTEENQIIRDVEERFFITLNEKGNERDNEEMERAKRYMIVFVLCSLIIVTPLTHYFIISTQKDPLPSRMIFALYGVDIVLVVGLIAFLAHFIKKHNLFDFSK